MFATAAQPRPRVCRVNLGEGPAHKLLLESWRCLDSNIRILEALLYAGPFAEVHFTDDLKERQSGFEALFSFCAPKVCFSSI
jgi:hypothetical protein